jgi:arabinose-5-phosphate isomerase
MLAVGDALALVVSRRKGFTPQNFATFHPAGSLGRQLKSVTDAMRPLAELRVAPADATVREVFTNDVRSGRRSGAVLLTEADGRLAGLFTDSDLARLLEQRRDDALDQPIRHVMTSRPATLPATAHFSEAIELLSSRKISEVPIVDGDGRPVGLIDITDVIGWMPSQSGA